MLLEIAHYCPEEMCGLQREPTVAKAGERLEDSVTTSWPIEEGMIHPLSMDATTQPVPKDRS